MHVEKQTEVNLSQVSFIYTSQIFLKRLHEFIQRFGFMTADRNRSSSVCAVNAPESHLSYVSCPSSHQCLFPALVFSPVKLLIPRFCEASWNDAVVSPSASCSGAPWAERCEAGGIVGVLLLRNEPSHSRSLEQLGWNNYIACAKLNSTHCERIERVSDKERSKKREREKEKDGRHFLWVKLSPAQQLSHYLQPRI